MGAELTMLDKIWFSLTFGSLLSQCFEGWWFTWLLVMVTQISESEGTVSELKGWISAEQT